MSNSCSAVTEILTSSWLSSMISSLLGPSLSFIGRKFDDGWAPVGSLRGSNVCCKVNAFALVTRMFRCVHLCEGEWIKATKTKKAMYRDEEGHMVSGQRVYKRRGDSKALSSSPAPSGLPQHPQQFMLHWAHLWDLGSKSKKLMGWYMVFTERVFRLFSRLDGRSHFLVMLIIRLVQKRSVW